MRKTYMATVYKDDAGFYPLGKKQIIHCNSVADGVWGINTVGEVIPAASATQTLSEPGTDWQHAQVGVRAGQIYPNTTEFAGTDFKAVVRVKDMTQNTTYYVDKASYDTNVQTCNDCCIPTECVAVTPEVDGAPTDTTADIIWTAEGAVVGYEWVNVENVGDCEAPTSDGTFTESTSVSLTELISETTYCFAVRAICGVDRKSDWAFVQFTTAA